MTSGEAGAAAGADQGSGVGAGDAWLTADVGLLAPVWAGTSVEAATGDTAFLQAMLDAEAALVRALAAVGRAPASAAAAVSEAAHASHFDVRDIAVRARAGGNPVIPLVADLTAAVPADAAAHVHRGATSQDILDTAMMLVAARVRTVLLGDLRRTAAALARLASAHRDTPMPGRTLTQHAVPTSFGLKAAGWRSLVLDAADRLARLPLPAQLGGAAGTLAAFEALGRGGAAGARDESEASAGTVGGGAAGARDASEALAGTVGGGAAGTRDESEAPAGTVGAAADPTADSASGGSAADVLTAKSSTSTLDLADAYAAELGLAAPDLPWHVLRTPIADLAAALAFSVGALGKVAADVLVLSRTEIGEVAEGQGGGSSAMPHKANPVRATLIAAAARQASASVGVLFGALAAEDERPAGAWHAEWQTVRELLRLAGGAAESAAGLAEGLRVFPERMLDNLRRTRGLVVSERLAAELGELVGRAQARRLVTEAARRAGDEGRDLDEVLAEVLAEAPESDGVISRERLRRLTDPAGYLGAAGPLVDRALRRVSPSLPGGAS